MEMINRILHDRDLNEGSPSPNMFGSHCSTTTSTLAISAGPFLNKTKMPINNEAAVLLNPIRYGGVRLYYLVHI